MVALASLSPVQQAILDYISGPESHGQYNIINGGQHFSSYSDHPRVKVPLKGGNYSTAAGRYQMLGSTWDYAKRNLGLSDFSPENQDRAAWFIASNLYKKHTKRELTDDWNKGAVDWKALAPVWTSVVHDPAKPKPGETPGPQPVTRPLDQFPGLVNPPELDALLKPGKPGASQLPAMTDPGATPASGLSALEALQSLFPQHQLQPVDYDPYKLTPHLEPVSHDPFNPPGAAPDAPSSR